MDYFILMLTGIAGATATYYVSTRLGQGPVRASAGLTLLVAGFFRIFPDILSTDLVQQIPVVFIGGSFIGMVSSRHLSTYTGLAAGGIVFTVLFLNASRLLKGYGGSLGTSACISLLVVLGIPYFKSKRRLTVGLLQLRKLIFRPRRRGSRRN